MPPAEIKLFVAAPSVKNWPLSLAGGALLFFIGAVGFALQAFGLDLAVSLACLGVAMAVLPALRAASSEYYVTSTRVVARSGLLAGTERSIAVASVTELRLKRSPLQRALGLGDLEVAGAAESLLLAGLEDPDSARERILSIVG